MDAKELAAKLDGRQYRSEVTHIEEAHAKTDELLIVFGGSDDLIEFRGLFAEECGAYEGGTAYVYRDGPYLDEGCDCAAAERERDRAQGTALNINALWCPDLEGKPSWAYGVEATHETFRVMEDDDLYCIGIVIAAEDIPER